MNEGSKVELEVCQAGWDRTQPGNLGKRILGTGTGVVSVQVKGHEEGAPGRYIGPLQIKSVSHPISIISRAMPCVMSYLTFLLYIK